MTKARVVRSNDDRQSVNATSAGLITTALTIINLIVGFGFQSLIAYTLGLGSLADRFQLTWAIVTFGTVVFFTLVSNALVPRMHRGTSDIYSGDLKYLAYWGACLTLAQILGVVLAGGDLGALLVSSAPSHLLASMTAGPMAVAYLNKRFAVAASGNVYNGLGLLTATTVVYLIGVGPIGLGVALTVGYAAQFIFTTVPMLPSMREANRHTIIGFRVLASLVVFTMLTKLQPLAERVIAESLGIGSTAALGFGQKISQGLLLLGAFGLALTATGSLSKAYANRDDDATANILARTLSSTAVATLLVMAAFLPVSQGVLRMLFQRGKFTSSDTEQVFTIFLAQTPWVMACAITGVLTAYLYVARKYTDVAICSLVGLVTTVGFSLLLQRTLPNQAVALSSSLGAISTMLYAYVVVKRDRIGTLGLRCVGQFAPAIYTVVLAFALVLAVYVTLISLVHSLFAITAIAALPATIMVACLRITVRNAFRELINARLH